MILIMELLEIVNWIMAGFLLPLGILQLDNDTRKMAEKQFEKYTLNMAC
jgi:hypothetical protein